MQTNTIFVGTQQEYILIPNQEIEQYDDVHLVKGLVDEKTYFLKRIRQSRERENEFIEKRIKAQKLLRMYDFWQDLDKEAYLILEYCKGGDISQILKQRELQKFEQKNIILDVGDQLDALHYLSYIHSDVKPINIVMQIQNDDNKTTQSFFLCDFGSVISINSRTDCSKWATAEYQSPESFLINEPLDFSTDIWSFAVTIFELMTRQKLFRENDDSDFNVKKKICQFTRDNTQIYRKIDQYIQEESLNKFIKKMMDCDPKQRPNISQVNQFFKEYFSQVKDEGLERQSQKQSQQFMGQQLNQVSTQLSLPARQIVSFNSQCFNPCVLYQEYKQRRAEISSRINDLTVLSSQNEEYNKELTILSKYFSDLTIAYQNFKTILQKQPL